MTTVKMQRDSSLTPEDDIKKQLQTSFCNVLEKDENTGSILFRIVYGFIIYNGMKDDLWRIKADCMPVIDNMAQVQRYAEKQFKLLLNK